MPDRIELRRGVYHDSVVLMRVTSQLRRVEGVQECLVAMATPLNLSLLDELGFDPAPVNHASTSDLFIAIRASSQAVLETATGKLDDILAASGRNEVSACGAPVHRTLSSAVSAASANLAVISIPGPHVVPEAVDVLLAGANVMVFSDGVTIEEERRLKAFAASRDLLVMGPDCGTARLGGTALGFCNELVSGDVAVVAASGTGAQHLACLLDARGIGIGQIVGVGGRDMTDDIGGVSTFAALRLLDADPDTAHIVIISKQPGPATAARLGQFVKAMKTPVTFALLGVADTNLTHAAREVAAARGTAFAPPRVELAGGSRTGGQLVGLFSGGTLAAEASTIIGAKIGPVADLSVFDSPTPGAIASFDRHLVLDLGDDRMTVGRPHPMIDSTLRREMIEALAQRPAARTLLLDIVLGHGADLDPAGAVVAPLKKLLDSHENVRVLVSFVGASRDPQGYEAQWEALASIGCDVYESNADAAAAVAAIVDE